MIQTSLVLSKRMVTVSGGYYETDGNMGLYRQTQQGAERCLLNQYMYWAIPLNRDTPPIDD